MTSSDAVDYERLTLGELAFAAKANSVDEKRYHLDRAARFATLNERARGGHGHR